MTYYLRNRIPLLGMLFVCVFYFQPTLKAQTPTIQDCLGAIPVCQGIYSEELSPSGDGNYGSEINTAISCTAGELNSIWYTFTVDQDGSFGFLITPNNLNDDYDWCLFNITNASCDDIFSDQSLVVSCNASGGGGCHGETGANGDTPYDIQGAGCNFSPPDINFGESKYNDLIQVQEGNTYVLMVSNWTGSNDGYTLDFEVGDATVFDNLIPSVAEVEVPDDCGETEIVITFSEFIQCSTIDASNFEVIGPSGPLGFTLSSLGCDAGGDFEKKFTLTLDDPLFELGNYVVNLLVDGASEALDLCDNPALANSFPFNIDEALALEVQLGPDTILCPGETLVLDATNPIADYSWQDGSTDSTFTVSTAGIYSVEVSNSCGVLMDEIQVDYTDEPTVELGLDTFVCEGSSIPLNATFPLSEYLWQDGSTDPVYNATDEGVYSVEVTNVCGTAEDEIFINFIPAIQLNLPVDPVICIGDTLVLDASNEDADYLWSTGWTGPILEVWEAGTYEVNVSTLCESVDAVVQLEVKEVQAYALGPDTLICYYDTLVIGQELTGATYEWQDGSTDPYYEVTESGTYEVNIVDPCGLIQEDINVEVIPPIEYDLGEDLYLCENQVFLDATTNGVASYLWSDGSNLPFLNAKEPGIYSVSVYNQCEDIKDQIELFECEFCDVYFPNIFSPNFDGINDEFRAFAECSLTNYSMQIFDRWGGLVYTSSNPTDGWDGTLGGKAMPSGVYTWVIQYTVIENELPREAQASGTVTILR
ncbi:MAG: gliding motility-associated C-terminal domain-containing protein [Bacteroidetes bacterium]|nr:gliding motility-associated C-terminal domain-containing protein [Bacteroidota bacterium]